MGPAMLSAAFLARRQRFPRVVLAAVTLGDRPPVSLASVSAWKSQELERAQGSGGRPDAPLRWAARA